MYMTMDFEWTLKVWKSQVKQGVIIVLPKQGKGHKKIAKELNVTRDTAGEKLWSNCKTAAARFVGSRHWVLILHIKLYTKLMPGLQNVHYLWSKRTRKVSSSIVKLIHISHKGLTILFCEVMKKTGVLLNVRSRKNEAYTDKNPSPTLKHGRFLAMLCGSFTSSGTENLQQDEFNQASGNARWKYYAVCDTAEAWVSLGLPGGQWSQAYCQVKQGLVSEVLQDSKVAISHLAWTLLKISVGMWRRQHAISVQWSPLS